MATDIDPAPPLPDLSQCDAEPIHIPGAIQPHGVLLALHGPRLRITQAAASTAALLGMAAPDLLERELATALDPVLAAAVHEALARYGEEPEAPAAFDWQPPGGGPPYVGYVHASGHLTVLELEPSTAAAPPLDDALAQAVQRFRTVRAQADLPAKLQRAAALFRHLTGYDRVMIYRFDLDCHGEVIAEDRRADLEPFLGLHYPASDIPAQARRLFLISPTRVIADVDASPSPLVPEHDPVGGEPLDLSRGLLRSVSPVHLEYLRNMGVRASLTVPLVRDGQLWGLIACHHEQPRPVAGVIRQIAAWMALDLVNEIALADEVRARRYAVHLKGARDQILAGIRQGLRLPDLLRGPHLAAVLGVVGAEGAALIHGAEITTGGVTPDPHRILAIAAGLSALHPLDSGQLFATEALSDHLAGTADLGGSAAGVVLFPLDRARSLTLLWFRPEQVRQVSWGGNPDKAVQLAPDGRLSPRQSFDAWTELVALRSRRWGAEELDSARELGALIDIERRKLTEDALRDSEERLQRVLEGANDGFWDWNVATGDLRLSERWAQMLGYGQAEIEPHLRGVQRLIHPDDLARVLAELQAHLSGATPRFESEHRMLTKDGDWRWVLARAKVTARDAQGQPLRMVGTNTDISERRRVEAALAASLAELQRHDAQMVALNRMNDLLLSCETPQEAYAVIAQGAATLFAPYAGGLAVSQGATELHRVAAWGVPEHLAPIFALRDCWALRRGQPHEVDPSREEPDCRHFPAQPPLSYVCVPLNVRGATLGLLHVGAQQALRAEQFRELLILAVTVGESIKLALSNLRLQEALRDGNPHGT